MQVEYDPHDYPERVAKEELRDLLTEGLYAHLDHGQGLHGADTAYWDAFKKNRSMFLNVSESLRRHPERDKDAQTSHDVRVGEVSVRAARDESEQISAEP